MHVRTSAAPFWDALHSIPPFIPLVFPSFFSERNPVPSFAYSPTPSTPPLLKTAPLIPVKLTAHRNTPPSTRQTQLLQCPRQTPSLPTFVTRVPQRCATHARNFPCTGTGAQPAYLSTYKPAPFHTRPVSKLIATSSSLHHLTLIEHRETCYQVAPPNKISLSCTYRPSVTS
jgi:hypothetical protein